MFTVELEGESEVRAAIASADRVLSDAPGIAVGAAVSEGADEARQRHAFKNRSGDLEKSIDGEVTVVAPRSAEGVIRAMAKHASYVEDGTPPHIIYAKKALNLRA